MGIPLIVALGLAAWACNDDDAVARDSDSDAGKTNGDAGLPAEPAVEPLSACTQAAQARLSLDGRGLLACAQNSGMLFEVFDGKTIQQYDVPANPPLLFGKQREAESVQNFAIAGADDATFVLTRYSLANSPSHFIANILYAYKDGEAEPRDHRLLYLPGDNDVEDGEPRPVDLHVTKNHFTDETNVDVVMQAGRSIMFSRLFFDGFQNAEVFRDEANPNLMDYQHEGSIISTLPPVRFGDPREYSDPWLVVRESAVTFYDLNLVVEGGIEFTDPFLAGFHPTLAPTVEGSQLTFPAPELGAEFLDGTNLWSFMVPGLSGKILVYLVSEAQDAYSIGAVHDPENWQRIITLPVEDDVLHVTSTPQEFDENGAVVNFGETQHYALTSGGAIFEFPLSSSMEPGDPQPRLIAQLENFDPLKARGFFVMNDQLIVALAGEEHHQYYSVPLEGTK